MTATKTSRKASTKTKASEPEYVTLASVYAVKAKTLDIDTTKAAKLIRSRLRSNFAKVCELSPNVTQHKSAANDGNRWPKGITRECAEYVLGTSHNE